MSAGLAVAHRVVHEVRDGALEEREVAGRDEALGRGVYDYRPAGATQEPWAVDEACKLLFAARTGAPEFVPADGAAPDGSLRVDSERLEWNAARKIPGPPPGFFSKQLRFEPETGEGVWLSACVPRTEYPEIEYKEIIIDACAMWLVQDPRRFDILLCENLYGDILSDLTAGLVGGLGVVPGANLGRDIAVFEAVHGSAPDIAHKNLANPTALLMSGLMMLDHIGERETSQRIWKALTAVLTEGTTRTRDLGGTANTVECGRIIAEAVAK